MNKPDNKDTKSKKENIYFNEPENNNTVYDISGNMNIWRIHETYEGSGNNNIWEEILNKKNKPFKNTIP